MAQFVELADIDPIFFDKPYYLLPGKGGAKGYVLLRDALVDSERCGLATVVIRTRQYVAALRPHGKGLVLQLLRYHQELRDLADFDMPESEMSRVKASKQERDMAMQLIDGMTDKWEPKDFHDEYHDAVMKMIKDKIASGETEAVDVPDEDETDEEPATINFIDVLRQSVEQHAKRGRTAPKKAVRKAKRKVAARKPATASKSKTKANNGARSNSKKTTSKKRRAS